MTEVFKVAAANGQEKLLYLFKEIFDTDISSWLLTAQLYNASNAGDKAEDEFVQMLIDEGVDPNACLRRPHNYPESIQTSYVPFFGVDDQL